MSNDKQITAAGKLFSARNARRNITEIWKDARWMDSPAIEKTVKVAAELLRDAGLEDVRIENLPADGKTTAAGWMMPPEWCLKEAKVELGKGKNKITLADYSENPQCIAQYSPATPGGKWLSASIVITDTVANLRKPIKGKIVLVTEGNGDADETVKMAEQGAHAIITINDSIHMNASRFANNALPKDVGRKIIPVFSLCPRSGNILLKALKSDPTIELRVKVKAKITDGTFPILTGSIGRGSQSIYICGHIDEIGALDNASGCGVAIEALRVMQAIRNSSTFDPQLRKIEFFFSTEVRGIQMWLNQKNNVPNFIGGINLDMVGAHPEKEPAVMAIQLGFLHRPHFNAYLIQDAAKYANRSVGKISKIKTRYNYVSDGMLGVHGSGGHTSLEQTTGTTYHSSADTPTRLCTHTVKWTGIATVSFLYTLSRMNNRDTLRLAKRICKTGDKTLKNSDNKQIAGNRILKELESLRTVITQANVYTGCYKPAELYRAGVKRSSGCWPSIEDAIALEQIISDFKQQLKKNKNKPATNKENISKAVQAKAEKLIPTALFKGFLAFQDHTSPKMLAELQKRTGLSNGWCIANWAWMAATEMRGKQNVSEIVKKLQSIGVPCQLKQVVNLTEYLATIGLVHLRPVITASMISASLRAAGVKKGSILTVHSSLSDFGYTKGGPQVVIDCLLKAVGPKGTLVMPTHSNSVLGTMPYDMKNSRSNTGIITEYFRKMPGVLRSNHATHSVVALGPAAAEIISTTTPDQAPLAREGFWGKLCDMDGYVLMMCKITSATIFHVGETWNHLPQLPLIVHTINKGKRTVFTLQNAPWHDKHFTELAQPLIKKHIMTSADLGESKIWLAPARAMADISVQANKKNPGISLARNGTCKCVHCTALKEGLEKAASSA